MELESEDWVVLKNLNLFWKHGFVECQLNVCYSGSRFETDIHVLVGLGFVVVGISSWESGCCLRGSEFET